jgi:60 kDa SS-A/Ro ribonucleoprotein
MSSVEIQSVVHTQMEVSESSSMITGDSVKTVENGAGGQSFQVSREQMFLRFLILGSDKPQYYACQGEQNSNLEHLTNILMMIEEGMGLEMVKTMINVSVNARAPKQTYTFIALALCSLNNNLVLKSAANESVLKICRIPTHLFEYIDLREKISLKMNKTTGWGKAQRRIVGRWYNEHKTSNELELIRSCTKYSNRHGYTHKDALRLCHSKPNSEARKIIYSYLTKGFEASQKVSKDITSEKSLSNSSLLKIAEVLDHIIAVEEAKSLKPTEHSKMCELIMKHRLVREHVPSDLLNSKEVWIELLKNMPLTALVRSLSKIAKLNISDDEEQCKKIVEKITDKEIIERSKIHPIQLLTSHIIYSRGYGDKGSLTWRTNDKIVKALDQAFELSFKNVVPSNKRILNAIDVSGSMTVQCNGGAGMPITCHQGAAVMALMMARVEPFCHSVCFTVSPREDGYYNYGGRPDLTELPLRKETTLKEAFNMTQKSNFGMTDCAMPIMYALEKKMEIDTFIVYTDSETYFGKIHPFEALKKYRKEMNLPYSKLVVVGMQSNEFTIADPTDPGMLDVVGFDSATPEIITNFSAGKI